MPKQVFWPLTIVLMGIIFMAYNLHLLPREFLNFWPLMFIVVGLGGLVTSDRTEWLYEPKSKSVAKITPKTPVKKPAAASSRRRK